MMKKEIISLLFVFALASCMEVALEPLPDKGEVTVGLDWENTSIPGKMTYVFYPDGGSPVTHDGAGSSFTGELPAGMYAMLAYEADAAGVVYSGMESYATARVAAKVVSSTRVNADWLLQPDELFSGGLTGLVVQPMDTIRLWTVPRQLTRSLRLVFALSDVAGVTEIEGLLCGIYPSLSLATGEPSAESVAAAPSHQTAFSVEVGTENKVAATVRFLGLRNPEGGKAYTNTLLLTLKGSDGWQQQTSVDLTRALTDIYAAGNEEFAFELPTHIEIKIEPTFVSLSAIVVGWTVGEGGGDIDYVYPRE